jgi:hypothetical protein
MKISELRIGNWVVVRPHDRTINGVKMTQKELLICQVSGIFQLGNLEYILVNGNTISNILIEDVAPIILTEETLEMAGMKRGECQYGSTFILNEERYVPVTDFWIEHWTNEDAKQYRGKFFIKHFGEVEFVHQLQNIVFIKKGIELNLDFNFPETSDLTQLGDWSFHAQLDLGINTETA